ncbi:hypothetical protein ACFSX9_00255 [Flavobacterium ardleyense]|uniref:Uncharacterized protein n=1 Tax=Flavobacterium ardleyense TaxID=2038737 RepID=A0ABW5Z2V8_9FLAO
MNKVAVSIVALLLCTVTFSQKAETEKKKVVMTFPKSDFFKNIKTYNIVIQGDDSWNKKLADEKTNTFENNVIKNKIEDYTRKDEENPDIKVLIGMHGSSHKSGANNTKSLEGDLRYLVLGKNNEIIYEYGKPSVMHNSNLDGNFVKSISTDLNDLAYRYLSSNNILLESKEIRIEYGVFEKVNDFSELLDYNSKTTEFLSKMDAQTLDNNYLDELEKFYTGFIGKEYKKLKAKDYNKVIYLNLTNVAMFRGDLEKAEEYLEVAKKNASMFNLWPDEMKRNIDGLVTLKKNDFPVRVQNLAYDSAYFIYVNGTLIQNDKKYSGKIKVHRFQNFQEGNILTTEDPANPKLSIEKENGEISSLFVKVDTTIKTESGLELKFLKYKGNFLLVQSTSEGCYKQYESTSDLVYCDKNGVIEIKN